MEIFKSDPSAMNEKLDQICAEIEKIKKFRPQQKNKFTKLELDTIPVQPAELNTSTEFDMTPWQPEGMGTTNKRVATSSQRAIVGKECFRNTSARPKSRKKNCKQQSSRWQ